MEELTGPGYGHYPGPGVGVFARGLLPGITGQIFRQFALVIAATAVISAINALTLKPAQCALWLRPRGEKPPTGSTGASTASMERWRTSNGPGPLDGGPVRAILSFFAVIIVAGWQLCGRPRASSPQRIRVTPCCSPACPTAPSQPRAREVTPQDRRDSEERRPGIPAWVTIGGFSFLDAANVSTVSTTFVVYEDWRKRGGPHPGRYRRRPQPGPFRHPGSHGPLSWFPRPSGAWASREASR